MASGWAPDGAVQDQIDDTVTDEVMRARARMPTGEGQTHCAECGDEIPEARRRALPGVRTCVECQSARMAARPISGSIVGAAKTASLNSVSRRYGRPARPSSAGADLASLARHG